MKQNEACQQILNLIASYKESNRELCGLSEDYKCIALARVGTDSQKLVYAPLAKLVNVDMGDPMHSLIVPAKLGVVDEEHVSILCDDE